jgi:hypothetical protein
MNIGGFHVDINEVRKLEVFARHANPLWPCIRVWALTGEELREIFDWLIRMGGKPESKTIGYTLMPESKGYLVLVAFEDESEALEFSLAHRKPTI